MTKIDNAAAWGLPSVLDYFAKHRNSTREVYESEWFFLKNRLREGMSVLDIGCALGGFAAVLKEHLTDVRYTGVDINSEMVSRARDSHPDCIFFEISEADLSILGESRFDLVLVLGILHLHEAWRDTVSAAWAHTGSSLIMDFRETDGETIEDKELSWFSMNFNGGDSEYIEPRLPYNVVNAAEVLYTVRKLCPGAASIRQFGYEHEVSHAARCPLDKVMTTAWCVER